MVRKVLVIDDSRPIHSLVKTHLDEHRYEVLSSYDGPSGLATAEQAKPDVILLDVEMPTLQGYEVCRQLKADRSTRQIPVLFLTSCATVDEKIRGLDIGASDYLTKPFEPAELRARLRAALRTKTALDDSSSNTMVDDLTGLFTRKYFDTQLDAELAAACRSGMPLGCILVDIDHMEAANELFGRQAGDELLHKIGQCISQACRREDVVCRFGGDEFAILSTGSDSTILNEFAERVRVAVRSAALIYPTKVIQLTASVGVAIWRLSSGTSILAEATEALRRAKLANGDCVRATHELAQLRLAV